MRKKNSILLLVLLIVTSPVAHSQSSDSYWDMFMAGVISSNLQFSKSYNHVAGVGNTFSNSFALRIESLKGDAYFFYKQNFIRNLAAPNHPVELNYLLYEPDVTLKNYSGGIGTYIFSELHDNVNFYTEFTLGWTDCRIKAADNDVRSDFMTYGLGVGQSQRITKQLRYFLGLHVTSPFRFDRKDSESIATEQAFENTVLGVEAGLQFILFRDRSSI
jgi:hypothetical protein